MTLPFKHTPTEARALWVAALRSDDYVQGRRVLRDLNDRYCCLGVACELFLEHEADLTREYSNADGHYTYDGHCAVPPRPVADWLGLNTALGAYGTPPNEPESALSVLNDTGKSFAEIADVIEAAPDGLFRDG